jgi:hypothetical protein
MNGTLAHELFARARFASHRVVMDGYNGAVGAYTLGTTCPPNVTYMGVATCGQTLTGDTTGAVSSTPPSLRGIFTNNAPPPTYPQNLPRIPAHGPARAYWVCVVVVAKPLPACARKTCSADLLSVSPDARTTASVHCYDFSL